MSATKTVIYAVGVVAVGLAVNHLYKRSKKKPADKSVTVVKPLLLPAPGK